LPGLAGWRWASTQLLMLLLILYRQTGLGKVRFQMPSWQVECLTRVEVSRIGVRAGRSEPVYLAHCAIVSFLSPKLALGLGGENRS
jgi:hypothetical protein